MDDLTISCEGFAIFEVVAFSVVAAGVAKLLLSFPTASGVEDVVFPTDVLFDLADGLAATAP